MTFERLDFDERTAQWRGLLERAKVARENLERAGDDRDALRVATREWWASTQQLLSVYGRMMARGEHQTLSTAPEMALVVISLSEVAGFLETGTVPDRVSLVAGAGTAKAGPVERRHVGWATAYLRLARTGVIDDKTATKTIQDAYKVERQTVQRWAKLEIPSEVEAMISNPEVVQFYMADSAAIYRHRGRSAEAIASRSVKRARVPS